MSSVEDPTPGGSDDAQITFNVKASTEAKHVFTLPAATTVADLKIKLSVPDKADIPPERQRLIYSGRVLKDPDTLANLKIKDGHTIHLVKSAASNTRQNPANQGGSVSTTAPGSTSGANNVPTSFATGTANDPLAALTGARYAGFHGLPGADMFGPDGGMGPMPNTQDMLRMMDDPNFVQQMNEALNNPDVLRMIRNSPMMRDNPMMQAMLDNPEMRRMLTNPDMIRMQMQMQRAMGGEQAPSFPAPGATNTTPQGAAATPSQNNDTTQSNARPPPPNPFALFAAPGTDSGALVNPFASLFGAPPTTTTSSTSPPSTSTADQATTQQGTPSSAPSNPFGGSTIFGPPPGAGQQDNLFSAMAQQLRENPDAMRSVMNLLNATNGPAGNLGAGAGAGTETGNQANPFASLFNPFGQGGFGAPPPQQPEDNRPPEERYADQLRQLNDMGFYEFERNVQALRRSGGSVQGAIEYLLSGS